MRGKRKKGMSPRMPREVSGAGLISEVALIWGKGARPLYLSVAQGLGMR